MKALAMLLAVALVVGIAFRLRRGDTDPGSGTVEPSSETTSPGAASLAEGSRTEPRGRAGSHPYRDQIEPIAEKLIGLHEGSAVSFAALFALTGSDSYLDELESRLKDNPTYGVQLAIMLNSRGGELKRLAKVLEQSLAEFPDSQELQFLQVGVLGKKRDSGATRAELIALDRQANIDLGESERYRLVREALLLSGEQASIAWVDGYTANLPLEFSTVSLAQGAIVALKDAQDLTDDERIDMASAMLHYTKGFNPDDDFTEIRGLISAEMETRALRLLDPATPYGDDGVTVADRLKEIKKLREKSTYVQNELRPYLFSQPPEVIQAFMERQEGEGLNAAIEWLERHRDS